MSVVDLELPNGGRGGGVLIQRGNAVVNYQMVWNTKPPPKSKRVWGSSHMKF